MAKSIENSNQNIDLVNPDSKLHECLPHTWLSDIVDGRPIRQKKWKITYHTSGPLAGEEKSRKLIEFDYYPTFQERMDAAKASAGFFSPKLSSQKVQQDSTTVIINDDYGDKGP